MASRLEIQVGATTRTLTATATDTQTAEMLKNFAWATGAPANATNAQLGDHVLRELVRYMVTVGQQYKQAEAARTAAIQEIGF
jgi:hypothetical protein